MNISGLLRTGHLPVFFISLIAVSTLSCNDASLSTHLAPHEMVIDGKGDDWQGLATTYYQEEQVSLGLASDATNLYLLLRTGRSDIARTLRMTGLTVWLDPGGKKEKNFKLFFKGGPMSESPRGRRNNGDTTMMGSRMVGMRDELKEAGDVFTCFQRDNIIEKPIPQNGAQGPSIGVDTSKGMITYEIAIPLKESQVRNYGLGAVPGQSVSIGFSWGEMNRSQMQQKMSSMGGKGGGGRGGMGGGKGGGRGGGRPDGMQMPSRSEIWITTELATPGIFTEPTSN